MRVMTGRALAAFAVLAMGGVPLHGQLRPEAEVLALTPPLVMEGLKADPFNYFRFVNRSWIARVCEVFERDLPKLGTVRLHGDAHVEQFAFTSNAWGLDDFDDSARGPAPVDIVRFLGSIELAVRQRGWGSHRDALFERFFDGYQRGVLESGFQPLAPDIVEILRAKTPTSRAAFLAWGETKMEPMVGGSMKAVLAGMAAFAKVIAQSRPELPADYFRVIRAGWLRIGVGSVVVPKILARVQGLTSQPDDDELLEGKALRHLAGLCLEETPTSPTLRVIVGTQQIGRLKHNILAAGPELALPEVGLRGQELRYWWIRSWDPSYREVTISDLRSVTDLDAIIYDAGVQLGAGAIAGKTTTQNGSERKQAWTSIAALKGRIRNETLRLVEELFLGWNELRGR